jgi:hypothetical protein
MNSKAIALFLIILTALSCRKPENSQTFLTVEKRVDFPQYQGRVQEIMVTGDKTRIYIEGYPKSRLLTLDEQDSIVSDFEMTQGYLVKLLKNGNWVRLGGPFVEVLDSNNQIIQTHTLLPTWPPATIYNEFLKATDNGFMVVYRYLESDSTDLKFRVATFNPEGDSILQKSFKYDANQMTTLIDIAGNEKELLLLGYYGHSGVSDGYKLLCLNEHLDTIWNAGIANAQIAHYSSIAAVNDVFHIVFSADNTKEWNIRSIDKAGNYTGSKKFSEDAYHNLRMYQTEWSLTATKTYSDGFRNTPTLQLLGPDASPLQVLCKDIELQTTFCLCETPKHYLIGGSRQGFSESPSYVRLKK